MSHWKHILVQQDKNWAQLILNRPKVLNALNHELLTELGQAVEWVAQSKDIRALIITGSGEKAFVAGADIREFINIVTGEEAAKVARFGQNIFQQIENLDIPVIMAVNGLALGGGCELALAGDLVIATEQARFGQPEINLGIIPGYGGTQRLARAIGVSNATYYCMTGEQFSAQQAMDWGWVCRIVPSEQLQSIAIDLAQKLATQPPKAISFIKQAIHQGVHMDLSHGLQLEANLFGLVWQTKDRQEGIRAFIEKRKPNFSD